MTSYAPSADSALVRQFHQHVEDRLSALAHSDSDVRSTPPGYRFDPDVAAGRQESVVESARVPAMLVLYSTAYFADADCGREWAIFVDRERYHLTGHQTSSMVCVKWATPTSPVPPAVAASPSWKALARLRDVRDLVRVGDAEYVSLVDRVAQELDLARRKAPDPLDPDLAALVEPAFPAEYNVINISPTPMGPEIRRKPPKATKPAAVRQRRPEPEYAFFVSHASKEHDRHLLDSFHSDLETALGEQLRRDATSSGFFAPRDIEPGNDWPTELYRAACTTPIMIALLCDDFVESGWCGWEWAVFTARARKVDQTVAPRPNNILPVTWLEFDLEESELPTPIRRIQRTPTTPIGLGDVSGATCLMNLMQDEPENYKRFVRQFAGRIRKAIRTSAPPIAEEVARRLPQAFGTFDDDGGPLAIDA